MSKRFLLVFSLLIIFFVLALGCYFYSSLYGTKYMEKPMVNVKIDKEDDKIINAVGEANKYILEGIVRKERIPAEMELGEYWYWLYFDEPYLLVNNAMGKPMYIDKIQLNPPEDSSYNLEDYVDLNVEVFGYQTWGYAESSVFQAITLRKL